MAFNQTDLDKIEYGHDVEVKLKPCRLMYEQGTYIKLCSGISVIKIPKDAIEEIVEVEE